MSSPITHHPSPVTRAAIVEAAHGFIGVPFRHQGRDPRFGVDCRGLFFAIAAQLGIQPRHEHRNDYDRNPDPKEFRAALESEFDLLVEIADRASLKHPPLDLSLVQPGDIFLIRFPRCTPEEATHGAVFAGDGPFEPMLIHAYSNDHDGAVIKEPLRRWEPYLVAAFTWPGLSFDERSLPVSGSRPPAPAF